MDERLSGDEMEQNIHHQVIEDLSIFFHLSEEQVTTAYTRELALLGDAASVRSYLPILVRRRIKNLFAAEKAVS